MGDWKTQLGKHPSNTGGGSGKKCACGRDINRQGTDICGVCYSKQNSSGSGAPPSGNKAATSGLSADYLAGGYFDERGNLFDRYVARNGDADTIAKSLGNEKPSMTNHQLRRFYGHVRAVDNRLRMGCNFSSVYIDLKKLEPFVSEAKGKGKIPELFYSFMIKNLAAVKTEKDFVNGFMEHFQAIVAYFTFHHPKK